MKMNVTVARVETEMAGSVVLVVGIGGPTASGKTTLAKTLAEKYQDMGVCLLDQDSYYLDRSHLPRRQREAVHYDEPYAIDHDLVRSHLESLLIGQAVQKPIYDFATHRRLKQCRILRPQALIILEGIHCFWDSRARALMELKVYVDADPDLRFIRRLQRDTCERKRSPESVIAQYVNTVRPMQKRYVEPFKGHADLVVSTTESFGKASGQLIHAVARHFSLRSARSRMLVA